jgi:hypothetical protein
MEGGGCQVAGWTENMVWVGVVFGFYVIGIGNCQMGGFLSVKNRKMGEFSTGWGKVYLCFWFVFSTGCGLIRWKMWEKVKKWYCFNLGDAIDWELVERKTKTTKR